jgi:transcriptional regulator
MHPDRRFAWTDRDAMLAFVAERAFCTIFAAAPEPAAFHVPVVAAGPDRLRFHISRSNRGALALEGARLFLSCTGPDAYVSPDWYGTPDQVPTWNYVAVEAEGPARCLSEEELAGLLDDLGAVHEARLAPKPPWTREKMSPGRFEGMLKAITGYELEIEAMRGTRKLGQSKKGAEMEGAIAGLKKIGRTDIAELMRAVSSSPSPDGEGAHRPAGDGGGVAAEASTIVLPHPPAADGSPPHASRREELG